MIDLKTLVKELKETQQLADTETLGTDPRTRPGREMARNQAKERLDGLRNKYKESVVQNVFSLLPVGPEENSQKFSQLAGEAGALVVDLGELYKTLAKRCEQTMGASRMFGITQFIALRSELNSWAQSKKVELEPLEYTMDSLCPTLNDTVEIVTEIIEKSNGQKAVKAYIEGQVVDQAIQQEVDTKVVPVVLLNATHKQSHTDFFRGKGLIVDTGQEVTPEFITKTFNQVKKLVKGNQ